MNWMPWWGSLEAKWLDFMSDARLLVLVLLLPLSSFLFPLSSFLFPRWTSSASSCLQWASPDLLCQLLIAAGLAGPPLPALDRSGRRRTSSARSWWQWASPDFNRRESERCGPRRTSTRESLSAVRLAELQPHLNGRPQRKPYRMPKRMSDRMPDRMSEDMPKRMPDRMPDRMSEDMPDRMSEDIPDRMSEDLPDRMPDRMSEYMPDRMSENIPDRMSEDMPDGMPDRMSEDMSDRMQVIWIIAHGCKRYNLTGAKQKRTCGCVLKLTGNSDQKPRETLYKAYRLTYSATDIIRIMAEIAIQQSPKMTRPQSVEREVAKVVSEWPHVALKSRSRGWMTSLYQKLHTKAA